MNPMLISYEPLNPKDRKRDRDGEPVGLKNIGNSTLLAFLVKYGSIACYFNALVQTYFYIPQFTVKILSHPTQSSDLASSNLERERKCTHLLLSLQSLFSKMALTNKKYTEPSEVLGSLVDDFGQ